MSIVREFTFGKAAKEIQTRTEALSDGTKYFTEFQCKEQLPLGWRVSVYSADGLEWDWVDFEQHSQALLCYNEVKSYDDLAAMTAE